MIWSASPRIRGRFKNVMPGMIRVVVADPPRHTAWETPISVSAEIRVHRGAPRHTASLSLPGAAVEWEGLACRRIGLRGQPPAFRRNIDDGKNCGIPFPQVEPESNLMDRGGRRHPRSEKLDEDWRRRWAGRAHSVRVADARISRGTTALRPCRLAV